MQVAIKTDDFEINRFTNYLISVRKVPAARIYKSSLRGFSFWLGLRCKTFDNFMIVDVQEYMSGIRNNSTANIFLGAIRAYMKFRNVMLPIGDPRVLIETQRENQLRGLKSRSKRIKREKVALTVDELKGFLAQLSKKPKTPRNILIYSGVIVHWFFGGGCNESRSLYGETWADLTFDLTLAQPLNSLLLKTDLLTTFIFLRRIADTF